MCPAYASLSADCCESIDKMISGNQVVYLHSSNYEISRLVCKILRACGIYANVVNSFYKSAKGDCVMVPTFVKTARIVRYLNMTRAALRETPFDHKFDWLIHARLEGSHIVDLLRFIKKEAPRG